MKSLDSVNRILGCCHTCAGLVLGFSRLEQLRTVSLPAEFQWRPPGLAARRRRFLMLTPPGESLVEPPKPGAVEEGVEERSGTGGVARNGISFTSVRKSEDLQQVQNKTFTATESIDKD